MKKVEIDSKTVEKLLEFVLRMRYNKKDESSVYREAIEKHISSNGSLQIGPDVVVKTDDGPYLLITPGIIRAHGDLFDVVCSSKHINKTKVISDDVELMVKTLRDALFDARSENIETVDDLIGVSFKND